MASLNVHRSYQSEMPLVRPGLQRAAQTVVPSEMRKLPVFPELGDLRLLRPAVRNQEMSALQVPHVILKVLKAFCI